MAATIHTAIHNRVLSQLGANRHSVAAFIKAANVLTLRIFQMRLFLIALISTVDPPGLQTPAFLLEMTAHLS
jgi:hypothetical protein